MNKIPFNQSLKFLKTNSSSSSNCSGVVSSAFASTASNSTFAQLISTTATATMQQKLVNPNLITQLAKVSSNLKQSLTNLNPYAQLSKNRSPIAAVQQQHAQHQQQFESKLNVFGGKGEENDKPTKSTTTEQTEAFNQLSVTSNKHEFQDENNDDLTNNKLSDQEKSQQDSDKLLTRPKHQTMSRSLLMMKCKRIVQQLQDANTIQSQNLRLQEMCNFVLTYPDSAPIISKEGGIKALLNIQSKCRDETTDGLVRQSLATIGYSPPLKGHGVRILTIDGGGTKGLVILECLRQLERNTGQPIHKLFDLICGVSTGAILATLLGTLHLSIDECEKIYKETSAHMFKSNIISGTSRLLLKHAYYDTERWEEILKEMFTDKALIETSRSPDCPKVVIISALMNTPRLQPFAFRNYNLPDKSLSYYESSCQYRVWEAIRASAAAPGYFEEFILDGLVHQDGGVLINNPAAIAIHESQILWPNEPIQTCVSIGSGKFTPTALLNSKEQKPAQTSLMTKIARLFDSATDTEGVHRLLQDLLPAGTYFRLNPTLTSYFSIDETDKDKLHQMKMDALMYLRKNEYKLDLASQSLMIERGYVKKSKDKIKQMVDYYF